MNKPFIYQIRYGAQPRTQQNWSYAGFVRLELICVLGLIAILLAIYSPLFAKTKSASERALCANNLGRVGRAFQMWGNDHDDLRPVMVPISEGGVQSHPLGDNAWFHYSLLSNELGSPKILRCPSHTDGQVATHWGITTNGGFINQNYRGNAMSYFVGTDVLVDNPGAFLAGDFDIRPLQVGVACSAGVRTANSINPRGSFWFGRLHRESGHILFNDGRVELLSSAGLVRALVGASTDHNTCHVLAPR